MFECCMCGECCKRLRDVADFIDVVPLDDGSGRCRYLVSDRCSIYDERPIFCRVDDAYDQIFKDRISKDAYYKLCYDACKKMKDEIALA